MANSNQSRYQLTSDATAGLIGDWAKGDGPLYRRLERALRSAVARRAIPPGSPLPPERELARLLAVSRTTVTGAYDALKDEGWLESREGSSTRVRDHHEDWSDLPLFAPGMDLPIHADILPLLAGVPEAVDLTSPGFRGYSDLPSDRATLPSAELAGAIDESVGYVPLGMPRLREAIAAWVSQQGLPTTTDQILVTSGAQQAISLATALLLKPGDGVVVENPTYYGAIDAFRLAESRLISVPDSALGIDVDRLRDVIKAVRPRLIYLGLTFRNPTGTLVSDGGRQRLSRLLDSTEIPVIDDLAFGSHIIDTEPPPPLAAYGKRGQVITVGSMSKLFWAGLRIGWLRADPPWVERLARLKVVADLGSSLPSQLLALRLLEAGDDLLASRRAQLRSRSNTLIDALTRCLPDWQFERPKGGVFVWARMPRGNATELSQLALRRGVRITPGSVFSIDGSFADHVRIPFVAPDKVLREGVERLALAWRDYASMATTRRLAGQAPLV